MEKMRRARYTLEYKLEALRLIGAGQSIAAVAATLGLATLANLQTPQTFLRGRPCIFFNLWARRAWIRGAISLPRPSSSQSPSLVSFAPPDSP